MFGYHLGGYKFRISFLASLNIAIASTMEYILALKCEFVNNLLVFIRDFCQITRTHASLKGYSGFFNLSMTDIGGR